MYHLHNYFMMLQPTSEPFLEGAVLQGSGTWQESNVNDAYFRMKLYLTSSYSRFSFENPFWVFPHQSWQTAVDCPQPSSLSFYFLSLPFFVSLLDFLSLSLFTFTLSFTAWLQPAACSLRKKTCSTNTLSIQCFISVYSHSISLLYLCTLVFHYFSFFLPPSFLYHQLI